MKNTLKYFQKAIQEKEILSGEIKIVQYHDKLEEDVVIVDLGERKGIVPRSKLDFKLEFNSLTGFIGRKIYFVPVDVYDEHDEDSDIICSRKLAQELVEEDILEKLMDGQAMDAQVTHFVDYGAFVEVKGISGLLKDYDFSHDYSRVKDVYHIGDYIKVRLKHVTEDNKTLAFQPVKKYKNPTILDLSQFERDQVVKGKIVNIQPWGVFVNIAPNLDALANVPATFEIEEGLSVSFRIKNVIESESKVRGKILRVL